MNKRIRNTILLVFALILCLYVTNALAVQTTISKNASGTVRSNKGDLDGKPLSGSVKSKSTSVNTYGKLAGYLDTHGSVFKINRDSAYVSAGDSADLEWDNPSKEEGKFSVALTSPGGHDGVCKVVRV